jgi:hypothetical protein
MPSTAIGKLDLCGFFIGLCLASTQQRRRWDRCGCGFWSGRWCQHHRRRRGCGANQCRRRPVCERRTPLGGPLVRRWDDLKHPIFGKACSNCATISARNSAALISSGMVSLSAARNWVGLPYARSSNSRITATVARRVAVSRCVGVRAVVRSRERTANYRARGEGSNSPTPTTPPTAPARLSTCGSGQSGRANKRHSDESAENFFHRHLDMFARSPV